MTQNLFQQYSIIVEYLGKVLGPDYEIVLHDLTCKNKEVVAIANGHISGRTVGSPLTNTALHLINSKAYINQNYFINYTGATENGHLLRSSTMFIKNKDNVLEGLLCINFDDSRFTKLNTNLLQLLHGQTFTQEHYIEPNHSPSHSSNNKAERFPTDISKLMSQIWEDVTQDIQITPDRLTQTEKISIIEQLHKRGLFNLKGSIPFISKQLASSTSSIYRYLEKIEN